MAKKFPDFVPNFPKLRFSKQLFENLIKERGQPILWSKTTMCPCVRADSSGKTQFACGECVNGVVEFARETLTAAVTNISSQKAAGAFGDMFPGGIFVTVSGDKRLGAGDRITLLAGSSRYSELCELASTKTKVITGAGDTELAVDHTRRFPGNGVKIMYAKVGEHIIQYATCEDNKLVGVPSTGTFSLPAGIPVGTAVTAMVYKTRYHPEVLYDVRTDTNVFSIPEDVEATQDSYIWFKHSFAMPTGKFTIAYDAHPVYIVDSLSHEHRKQLFELDGEAVMSSLPVAAVCRRDIINRLSGTK
jgi:hypothetical protein